MSQPVEYEHLEALEKALVEQRRYLVEKWSVNEASLEDTGRAVVDLNEMLAAVRAAAKEERQARGFAGFIG